MNHQGVKTLAFFFACWVVMCLACSDHDKAAIATGGAANDAGELKRMREFYYPSPTPTPDPRPTPYVENVLSAENGKKVRNALGLDDGWTAAEIPREQAERAAYQQRLAEWEARQGGKR